MSKRDQTYLTTSLENPFLTLVEMLCAVSNPLDRNNSWKYKQLLFCHLILKILLRELLAGS